MQTTYNTRQHYLQLLLASLIFSSTVHSASTDISDIPMAIKNTATPNIMFTLDDSGSMQFEVTPENDEVYYVFPRPATVYGTYIDRFTTAWAPYNLYWYRFASVAPFDSSNKYARYFRTSKFNRLYYDPAKRYLPWTNTDGSLMSNAAPSAAPYNPYNTGEGTINLTTSASNVFASWKWSFAGTACYTYENDPTCYYYTPPSANSSHTFYPATYFTWTGSGTLTGPTDGSNTSGNFTLTEIKSSTNAYPTSGNKGAARTDCVSATQCTYAEEIQNFANWFSYYRSRILLSRAGVGQAFAKLSDSPRVGFAAINKGSATIDGASSPGSIISGVRKFNATGRSNFYSSLYGHTMPSAGTPLRKSLEEVGKYFQRTDDNGPWGDNPGTGGGTQAECRQSYNILMTDGYWNGSAASTASGNVDNTTGPAITNNHTATTTLPNPALPASYQYTAASPYLDSYSDTLADVAMYYWNHDLRTDLANKVPTNTKDIAFWQHLVNLTVGLGVSGSLSDAAILAAFNGTATTWTDPSVADSPAKIDDLAHAAVNSRGAYLNASDPTTFASALSSALNDIIGRESGAAAGTPSNPNPVEDDNYAYQVSYNSSNWSGELNAYPIDLNTGNPSTTSAWSSSAKTQLDLRTSANRKIVTYTGTTGTNQGIQFQPTTATTTTKLSAAQQTLLNSTTTPPGTSDGANVVAFLRGDRSLEGTSYRSRTHLLGDIINAEPVIVRKPYANYADDCYATVTSTCATPFKTAQSNRANIIFQGANDGMLHAFNADSGAEEWAYIPNLILPTLNNLSKLSGFTHLYYVDGTPVSGDVDFSNTDGISGNPAPVWKTILVGGLNKGGRGFYALDVTTTTPADEATAAAKVLWEFPNSATSATVKTNIGYSFGNPIIAKVSNMGWVVLVTSGYNNGADTGGDGHGYLFVLNIRTGELIKAIDTGVGTSSDPSGLAKIAAYTDNGDIDNTVTYVYGGDLKGNVWRFDLTANNVNSWEAKRLAILKDGSANIQPITTIPELAKITINGSDKQFVYIGTGKYLGDSDIPSASIVPTTQTMYGLIDDLSSPSGITPVINDPTRSSLQVQTLTLDAGSLTRTASANTVNFTTQKGWYIDMPNSGERNNTDPALALGVLAFTSNIPSSDVCKPGGSSWITYIDYQTGGKLTNSTTIWSSKSLGNSLSSRVVLYQLPTGKMKGGVTKSDGTGSGEDFPIPPTSTSGKRVSWRALFE